LTWLFFEFFLKKKGDPQITNLKRLVDAFDTVEDPTLQLKRLSVKRGAEGTMALLLSHGRQVDWAKVSSLESCSPSELKKFFVEAKKYSKKIVDFILPALTLSSTTPISDAPPPPAAAPSEES
jgi:hypothetical protein